MVHTDSERPVSLVALKRQMERAKADLVAAAPAAEADRPRNARVADVRKGVDNGGERRSLW